MFTRLSLRRGAVALIAAALSLAACSSKSRDAAVPTPVIETQASAEPGQPAMEGEREGFYPYIVSEEGYERTSRASSPSTSGSAGALLHLKGPGGQSVAIGFDAKSIDRLRLNSGWSLDPIDEDETWHPATCAAVPHVVVAKRWVVMIREQRLLSEEANRAYDPMTQGTDALIEIFDTETKQYFLSAAAKPTDTVFSLSLRVEEPQSFSFLWGNGPLRGSEVPTISRRTVALTTGKFTDERIDLGSENRLVFARAAGSGYLVDVDGPDQSEEDVFASLGPAAGGGSELLLTPRRGVSPFSVAVSGPPGSLKLTAAKPIALPTDYQAATIVTVQDNVAYLFYRTSLTAAISSEGLATVDLADGKLSQAFDHTKAAGQPWATGASRLVVLGVM